MVVKFEHFLIDRKAFATPPAQAKNTSEDWNIDVFLLLEERRPLICRSAALSLS